MLIIPAIDLRDGKCVRLVQGKAYEQTTFSSSPAEVALKWNKAGAKRLHVVDLDGAFCGEIKNIDHVKSIRANFDGIIEFGGGIRTDKDIDKLLSAGVDRIILGTMAYQDEEFVTHCCDKYGKIFIAGIDARGGFVAIKGWVETTDIHATTLARKMESLGIQEIIFTDIMCDGMLTGPNIESLRTILNTVSIPVIASGGISSPNDLEKLSRLEKEGLLGAIIGKALYTGDININEVIQCWQSE